VLLRKPFRNDKYNFELLDDNAVRRVWSELRSLYSCYSHAVLHVSASSRRQVRFSHNTTKYETVTVHFSHRHFANYVLLARFSMRCGWKRDDAHTLGIRYDRWMSYSFDGKSFLFLSMATFINTVVLLAAITAAT
jgi:hypothetical protein